MARTHKDDVKWKDESPHGLGQRMIDENRVDHQVSHGGDLVTLTLECAVCEGTWTAYVNLHPVRSFRRRERDRGPQPVPFRCECGESHRGAPKDVLGCGRAFGLSVG